MNSKARNIIIAKTSNESNNLYLPLSYHHKDTKGVIVYLAKNWLPDGVYDELCIDRDECIKLCSFLAMVHDIGKATPVFQNRIIGRNDELRNLLESKGLDISNSFMNEKSTMHPHAGANILRCFDCPEDIATIVGAHHGKPENDSADKDDALNEIRIYKTSYGSNADIWKEIQRSIFNEALNKSGYISIDNLPKQLPDTSQMILTGLLIMADWIASNQEYFPLIDIYDISTEYEDNRVENAMKTIELPDPYYMNDYWKQKDFFVDRFEFEANKVQEKVKTVASNMKNPGIIIIEAPMGKGKTEAALAASEILINRFNLGGLAFFLPSQATSNAMFDRIKDWLKRQPDVDHTSLQLIHSNAELNQSFAKFEEGYVQIDEDDNSYKTITAHGFFRGRKTKLLANVVIGTVDQLLMASLKQKHIMLRHLGLMGKVVVIDECHAYDAYMNKYLETTLKWLSAYHIPVILLSATLPGHRRSELLKAYAGSKKINEENISSDTSYPLISWYDTDDVYLEKVEDNSNGYTVEIVRKEDADAVADIKKALDAGGCIGIILNTVKRVQEFYEEIRRTYPNANILVDHSQFILGDRLNYENIILDRVGKRSTADDRRNVIVIGTQVLEQSLDLDFDLLITDLCPMDLLMQRLGRQHRHKRNRPRLLSDAKCIVLGSDIDNIEAGAKAIYGEYLLKKTSLCLPRYVNIPKDISILVHKVYDGDDYDNELMDCREEYNNALKISEEKAEAFLLQEPCNDEDGSSIKEMLDCKIEFTNAQANSAVRDGVTSIEVIVIRLEEYDKATIISGEHMGYSISIDRQPSREEAKIIASQRLRLPSYFSKIWNIDRVIEELEKNTNNMLAEWIRSPILEREVFLILDKDNRAILDKNILQYDKIKGLIYKKEDIDEG